MNDPLPETLYEAYQKNPDEADKRIWGRVADPLTRRGFFRSMGLATMASALGAPIPFAHNMPSGLIPAAFAEDPTFSVIEGKKGLRVLNDRPINAETPVTLLDDDFTPNHRHFVRNNGMVPARAVNQDSTDWQLTIDGEVGNPLQLSLEELKRQFPIRKAALTLECGGNGRAGFNPPAKGNQWTLGAVGCAWYRGVRVADVLKKADVKRSAVFMAYYGEDRHLSGNPQLNPISRGVPIEKAMDENTLLVWEMNGESLPALHGFPVRLICPGWPASTSGKWLKRLWIRDQVHDGAKMTGYSYRVPKHPVAPGTEVPESDMETIQEMPVKSIITFPGSGLETALSEALPLRGHAWSGKGKVQAMDLSIDFGTTWSSAELKAPVNHYAWQRWKSTLHFPGKGYYEVWARATDSTGQMQSMLVPGWNPKGYLNNGMQRIAVKVV